MTRVPAQIAAAVDLLRIRPEDTILEIGCGNGVAAALVCERLGNGRMVAIDRSETQIRRARERNHAHLAAGTLTLHVMTLERATLHEAPFDTIFAINVNCFWLRAEEPLAAVRRLLKRDGVFYVFYEHPTSAKMRDVASVLRTNLAHAGMTIRDETTTGPVYALASALAAQEWPDMAATPAAPPEADFPGSVAQHVDFAAPHSTNS
ncbi:class I SAM-dependent methyltransferase [Sphaerobacter sp.]|uniref:SAM-dependent methyltransferase n=1 Tax=Sphaerobacter sp. TaxID=2099654 RepID=UPI001DAC74FD|nr:class I SAM-dependent methyltransferase [Sphaerobacter sp.]MBX5446612.1 class I SAM-dependent methyltransferase [Sphaerobacter sp.]